MKYKRIHNAYLGFLVPLLDFIGMSKIKFGGEMERPTQHKIHGR